VLNYFNILLSLLGAFPGDFSGHYEAASPAQLYIENYKEDAVKEMFMYNIPASITLAQGMLESGYGTSDLAIYANNHFGIKCHDEWDGPTYIQNDDEKNECFRKYPTVLDSYTDHSLFLKSRARYAQLFELNHTDYRGWAMGLKETGYATDPNYADRLLDLIESYELFKFDLSKSSGIKKEQPAKQSKHEKKEAAKKAARQLPPPSSSAGKKPETGIKASERHEILRLGIVKYIIIKPNDTFTKIAKETDKDLWQLYKYNDMSPEDNLIVGQKLYLQPKRKKAKEPFHIVKKGETMKSISQLHGIRLKQLYKKNAMGEWDEPIPGQQLYLRQRKK
jgi:LysM repeat protein